jgi:hypothetical protein
VGVSDEDGERPSRELDDEEDDAAEPDAQLDVTTKTTLTPTPTTRIARTTTKKTRGVTIPRTRQRSPVRVSSRMPLRRDAHSGSCP